MKIGFLGAGAMGGAILCGAVEAGVRTLEEHGFRGACIDTVSKATIRARELGKK